ncbi:DNRLRE domain-containing protein [Streptomyces cinerochromogenes]|uniref:DNRLRE domain-containing protein n=1 Tax=Streptomyces cinerochromogenes TaxID=66422 RepID=UPI0033B7802D
MRHLFKRRRTTRLATAGGVFLLALSALTVPRPAPASAAAPAQAPALSEAALATATASPYAQSGPRNLIKRLQDTYISSADTADHSQGHLLHVGTPDNGATKYRSFLRFDVSRLTGANISKAYLRVYNSYVPASDCGKNPWMGVYRVAEPWDEHTITWANQPAVGEGIGSWFGLGHPDCPDVPNKYLPDKSNGIQRIDVTDMVKGWTRPGTTTPNYGLRLSTTETGASGYKDFCSMNPTTAGNDAACTRAYFAPTLEVEFNSGSTPIITGNEYGPPYADGYPVAHEALEFLDSANPSVWPDSKPYQRWLPDAYHSVDDTSLNGANWKGGTSHKLRPGGVYGGNVLVTGDGGSGFVGVIPYPALSGYHWAINVNESGAPADLHGVELLPNGSVVTAFPSRTIAGAAGGLRLYSRAAGTPGAWHNTPAAELPLPGAHEVVYDPASGFLWALGSHAVYKVSVANGSLSIEDTFYLPRQTSTAHPETGDPAYGHDLTPVYGNPDRLWVSSNGGLVQFSKSGSAVCYDTSVSQTWPVKTFVETLRDEKGAVNTAKDGTRHWCNDYPHAQQINTRKFVKSIGNDPVTGKVATTCADECPLANTHIDPRTGQVVRDYHTAVIEIIQPDGSRGAYQWSDNSKHYRATWAVPSYQ